MSQTAVCAGFLAALAVAVTAGCGDSNRRRETNASAQEAAVCLRKEGARVSGDPNRRPPGDDAPDRELVAAFKSAGVFIGFYASEARAKALEPGLRENARRFNGVVARDQNTTVIYTKKPSDELRERVEGCLF